MSGLDAASARITRAGRENSARAGRINERISPRKRVGLTAKHVVLIVMALFSLIPVILLISTAFKTSTDVKVNPFGLFSSFSFQNIAEAWTQGQFSDYVWNTVILAVPTTALVIALSTMAGYAFARLPFRGRSIMFYVVILGLLVPFSTYMIPLFFELRSLALLDTVPGVILVLTTNGLAFGTFFMRAFFTDLPIELEQAARIDGASEWQIFSRVMLPLVGPGISALAVFTFLGAWNSFLVPLLYLPSGGFRPVTTALYVFASGRVLDIGPLAAAALISIIPVLVLFIVMQKQVATGFISGAVKG